MLDEDEGSGKDQFLGDPDWLSEMQYDTIRSFPISYPEPSCFLLRMLSKEVRRLWVRDWVFP